MMVNNQMLLERGYTRYDPDPCIHLYISDLFQKRFDDDIGVKCIPDECKPEGQ